MTRMNLIEAYVELHLDKDRLISQEGDLQEVNQKIWDLTLQMKATEIKKAHLLLTHIKSVESMGSL